MKPPARQDRLFLLTASVLLIALLLGGAGNYYPVVTAVVEAAALGLICYMIWVRSARHWTPLERFGALAAFMTALVPILHLVPLPPELWTRLPGRALPAESLRVAGLPLGWRPLSLDPEATVRSALELLPGLAMFFACLRLRAGDRLRLLDLIVAIAILSAVLGGLQKATGGADLFTPFASGHRGLGTGLFVNRNHQATFLLVAMLLVAGLPGVAGLARADRSGKLIRSGLVLLFAAGVVATTSRMGFVLLPFALLLSMLLLFPMKLTFARLGAAVAGLAAFGLLLLQGSAAGLTVNRFREGFVDARFDYWTDLLPAISTFWPAGSGLGTFARVFPIFESLDSLGANPVRNAHSDYLELLLETGLLGALLLLLGFLFFAGCVARLYRQRGVKNFAARIAALAAILLLLLHSAVDYPIRMLSLIAVFGLLAAFLAAAAEREVPAGAGEAEAIQPRAGTARGVMTRSVRMVSAALLGLVGLLTILTVTAVDRAVLAGDARAASAFASISSDAAVLAAAKALSERELTAAEEFSLLAIRNSPLNVRGITLLGLVREAGGLEQEAIASMSVAGSLGWRNAAAQLWIANKAAEQGDFQLAVLRADALLRQGFQADPMIKFLRSAAESPEGRAAIVERLAVNPSWRARFLGNPGDLEPSGYGPHETILAELKKTDHPPSRSEINAYVSHLVERRQFAPAVSAWRRLHGQRAAQMLLADSHFEDLFGAAGETSPLDWKILEVPGADIVSDSDPIPFPGEAVRVQANGSAVGAALDRLVVLPAGRYIFEVHARDYAPGSLSSLNWVVSCVGGQADIEQATRRDASATPGWVKVELSFTVPPAACPAQRIALFVGHQSGGRLDAAVAAPRLTSAQAGR